MKRINKNLFYWVLYDFANSIAFINLLVYFSQWIVIDKGLPELAFNISIVVSSIMFIVSSFYFSKKLDQNKKFIEGIRDTTILNFIFYLLTFFAILLNFHIYITITLFTFAIYLYLLSFIYFTPLLVYLYRENNTDSGFVSGIGQAGNSLGQVFGLLVTLPFVSGQISLFGLGRAETFLPSFILTFLFSIPMLYFFKLDAHKYTEIKEGAFDFTKINGLEIFKHSKFFGIFLVVYILLGDALLTFSSNFSLYLERVHNIVDTTKALMTISILLLSAFGAFAFSFFTEKFGDYKLLFLLIGFWIIIFPCFALVADFNWLLFLTLLAGFFFGPTWSVSRSIFSKLIPHNFESQGFSFYIITERIATIFGPLVWGYLTFRFPNPSTGYGYALSSLSIILLVSLIVYYKYFKQELA